MIALAYLATVAVAVVVLAVALRRRPAVAPTPQAPAPTPAVVPPTAAPELQLILAAATQLAHRMGVAA